MQAAESILRTARDTWREHHPCERKALRPVEAKFEKLQNDLYGHIKMGWDKNVAAKKAIIEAAQALVEAPLEEQIQAAKQLQQQWQHIGPTQRGINQRLWKEFRQQCDQIFARRDADNQAQKHQQTQFDASLISAVEELEQMVATAQDTGTLVDNRELQKRDLSTALAKVDAAAQNSHMQQNLRKRITAAQSEFEKLLGTQKTAQAKAKFQLWLHSDQVISQWEQSDTSAQPTIETPDSVFAARLAGTAEPEDWLKLTLTAEVAAGCPSPTEDQPARMALQVELMNAGVREFSAADKKQLLQRWCGAGPKNVTADQLRERFFAALGS